VGALIAGLAAGSAMHLLVSAGVTPPASRRGRRHATGLAA
jgi:hypothetical protein